MYQFKTEKRELTKEEQEKAKFIIDVVKEKNEELAKGKTQWGILERAAFETFKFEFYRSISFRLNLNLYPQDSLGLTDDGLKVIIVSIEKSER